MLGGYALRASATCPSRVLQWRPALKFGIGVVCEGPFEDWRREGFELLPTKEKVPSHHFWVLA
eukprot:3288258-Amphidinium_carterae.1